MTVSSSTKQFILENRDTDVHTLALNKNIDKKDVDFKFALEQIVGRQKVAKKIPTFYNNDDILYPTRLSLEQSSSEITATHKAQQVEGKLLIDITGGFGIDTYFFSKKIEQVLYIEKNKALCQIAQHNFRVLGSNNVKVIHSDATQKLSTIPQADWIYIDPARRGKKGEKKYFLQDLEPNILNIVETLLSKSDQLMCKLSPMIDISLLRQQIPNITEIQIISVKNECKELLAIIQQKKAQSFSIKTFDYSDINTVSTFSHKEDEQQQTPIIYATEVGKFLYEPNSAILKGGLFAEVAQRYKIKKLHKNSHLYTSSQKIENFPGRKFIVEQIYHFNKKGIKAFRTDTTQTHLTIRNFPLSVDGLQKKLNVKVGGDSYTFGTTILEKNKILIKTTKLA